MGAGRHSLAWKIALANILLALFAVLTAVTLQYRKERRRLEDDMRRELSQALASGALSIQGERTEALANGLSGSDTRALDDLLRSLALVNPSVARIYILGRGPNGLPHLVSARGVAQETDLAPAATTRVAACFNQGLLVTTPVYEDADGEWLSAFYPLRNTQGRVVAVLGADLRASDLKVEARGWLKSTLLSGLAAVAVGVVLSVLLARGVTRPLKLVAASTSEIAAGNLNICLNLRSRDEIGELANSFNRMVERLAAAAEERDRLHHELLEKQRWEQELSLAAEIQQSFLPVFFPHSPRYQTNARTMPAEVVGGDFYDFVEFSDDRLGIAIGDVAGRGIAAAVYLARLVSDFRAAALRAGSPHDVLERLNQQLLVRSTRGLFVTMTYLVLDSASGELRYSSAGHLPILRRKGETGIVEVLAEDRGLPLGIVSRPNLCERCLVLEPRETLLLVTDGVIEALSGNHATFDFDRLVEIFRRQPPADNRLVDAVFEEIGRVSAAARPEDDMTVLTLSLLTSPVQVLNR